MADENFSIDMMIKTAISEMIIKKWKFVPSKNTTGIFSAQTHNDKETKREIERIQILCFPSFFAFCGIFFCPLNICNLVFSTRFCTVHTH